MTKPYQLSSTENIRYNRYQCEVRTGCGYELAEERAITETIVNGNYLPVLDDEFEAIQLRDLCECLETRSGPEFLALYRHCIPKYDRGDLPETGEVFDSEKANERECLWSEELLITE